MSDIDFFCVIKGLELQLDKKEEVVLNVVGNSMIPVLVEGDRVYVGKADDISAGDIIVFVYKMNLLVHRILYIRENTLYCKGDNSFRIEEITSNNIIGKVIGVMAGHAETGQVDTEQPVIKLLKPDEEFLSLSMAVGREFLRLGCDKAKTRASQIFLLFQDCVDRQFNVNLNKSYDQNGEASE